MDEEPLTIGSIGVEVLDWFGLVFYEEILLKGLRQATKLKLGHKTIVLYLVVPVCFRRVDN